MASSVNVTLVGGLTVYVQAFCNAGFGQTVLITPPSSQGSPATFSGGPGQGNIPLPLTTKGFLTPSSGGGWPSFTTPGNASQNDVYVVKCSNTGGGTSAVEVNNSTYQTSGQGTMYLSTVVSEDSTDQDYNDSVTFFTAWTKP